MLYLCFVILFLCTCSNDEHKHWQRYAENGNVFSYVNHNNSFRDLLCHPICSRSIIERIKRQVREKLQHHVIRSWNGAAAWKKENPNKKIIAQDDFKRQRILANSLGKWIRSSNGNIDCYGLGIIFFFIQFHWSSNSLCSIFFWSLTN